jgi:hypothetical protein
LATSMTLPSGYKTFVDDVVLPADEINGFLMQGILVFTDASDRDTSLVGNLREGQYAYLQSDKTTYVYSGTAWQRVGKQDVETVKNFQSFTASGGATVPDWATKMYYLIVGGGGAGNASGTGGAGGQVVQNSTAVTGGTSLTVTVGGAAANSSLAISGGSTFTATGAGGASGGTSGGAAGTDGSQPSAPFNIGYFAGGGGGCRTDFDTVMGTTGGFGGGGHGLSLRFLSLAAKVGAPNSGGGGGATKDGFGTPAAGGSGIVLLYFS